MYRDTMLNTLHSIISPQSTQSNNGPSPKKLMEEARTRRMEEIEHHLPSHVQTLVDTVLHHPDGPSSGVGCIMFELGDFLRASQITAEEFFGVAYHAWLRLGPTRKSVSQLFLELLQHHGMTAELRSEYLSICHLTNAPIHGQHLDDMSAAYNKPSRFIPNLMNNYMYPNKYPCDHIFVHLAWDTSDDSMV
jgi:hypothetical protein